MKTIAALTLICVFAYLSAAGLLYVLQRDFLYFPTEKYQHPFDRAGVSSQGELIEVLVLNEGNDKALIYFGGNGEAVVAGANEFASNLPDCNVPNYLRLIVST